MFARGRSGAIGLIHSFALASTLFVASACENATHSPLGPRSGNGITADRTGASRTSKVDICHRTNELNRYVLISIAAPALTSHRAHGDGAVGEPVPSLPGMVFNDRCAPVTAEQILFDNGPSSGPQQNYGNNVGSQELFEDFTLSESTVVTKIVWQQHDHMQSTYLNTQVVIFAGLPYSGSPVFSSIIIASRVPNATPTLFGAWEGFDYTVSGLSISLPPGTYWLGLNANFNGIRCGWDNTTGGPSTIPGSGSSTSISQHPAR